MNQARKLSLSATVLVEARAHPVTQPLKQKQLRNLRQHAGPALPQRSTESGTSPDLDGRRGFLTNPGELGLQAVWTRRLWVIEPTGAYSRLQLHGSKARFLFDFGARFGVQKTAPVLGPPLLNSKRRPQIGVHILDPFLGPPK